MKDGEIAVAQTPEINMMAPDLEETWCLSFWYLAYGRVSLFLFHLYLKLDQYNFSLRLTPNKCSRRLPNISSAYPVIQFIPRSS